MKNKEITKKELDKARAIIKAHQLQINKSTVNDYVCICCKTNKIKRDEDFGTNPLEQEDGFWYNGTVEKISFGFGSDFDTASFYIAICDSCISKCVKDGLAIDCMVLYRSLRHEL